MHIDSNQNKTKLLNATYLFEEKKTDGSLPELPHKSESFWTTIFALFLLHLGNTKTGKGKLPIFQCIEPRPNQRPWYERRHENPILNLAGLKFEDLTVEPPSLAGPWFHLDREAPQEKGGFRPDVVIAPRQSNSVPNYILIENKTIGSNLTKRQMDNYTNLFSFLSNNKINCEFLLLLSVGNNIDKAARKLQEKLKDKFGLLLWEDILRQMKVHQFQLPGINIEQWQEYAKSFNTDVKMKEGNGDLANNLTE